MTALVAGAVLLHWTVAQRRSTSLLNHDEAISLLASAGKSQRIDSLYEEMLVGPVVRSAGEFQNLLRPTSETKAVDVVRSLSQQDIHPPLYFLIIHALARLGLDSESLLRLAGSAMLLIATWAANRWIWPEAWGPARWLGTAWLLLTPAMVNIATEIRQYALVYLGVVIGIAALLMLWEGRKPARHTLMLLALSPVILLWTQLGTVVWVALGLVLLIAHTAANFRERWKLAAGSVTVALVLLAPLVLWASRAYAVQGRPASGPLTDMYAGAVQPLCVGLTETWCWLPWVWRETAVPPAAVLLISAGMAAVAWRRGRRADWMILVAGVAWGAAWLVLLAAGRVPPHAVEPKQLAPLALMPVCLIVRSAARAERRWVRGLMTALLAVSVGGLCLRTPRMLEESRDAALLTALAEADGLITDAPKRGYLLPLTERMRRDAVVIVASPQVALAQWPRVAERLPNDRLLAVEMGMYDGRREVGAEQLSERLTTMYRDVQVLRQGPKRTVTEFNGRRDDGAEEGRIKDGG